VDNSEVRVTDSDVAYSVGFGLSETMVARLALIPAGAWTPAYDSDRAVREGAWVAEATGVLELSGWPPGMRVIVRKERPHPGAQLRFTDADGLRLTAFATNTRRGQLADLELRHRRRARCEDRIRAAKSTGLQNLPLHGFDQNRIWCALVVGLRPDRLGPNAGPGRAPRPAVGTQTLTVATVLHRGPYQSTRPTGPAAGCPNTLG
jgi:hypothetical protein